MLSSLEFRRVLSEWQLRLKRVQAVLQPPVWTETDWRQFALALTMLVQRHGSTWQELQGQTWDLRWQMKEGGELVCQVEQKHLNNGLTLMTLVVAQCGGFAGKGSYTWLWAEFDQQGAFSREPYWVEGAWKEALMALLMPYQYQTNFLLQGQTETPPQLMLGGAKS